MKIPKWRSIYVSLISAALVFSLAGCTHTSTTEQRSETTRTGQSEVREMTDEGRGKMQEMATQSKAELEKVASAGKAGFQDLSQKAELGFEKIAASSNEALRGIGMKSGYGAAEKEQFLTGCKQSCAKEGPKTTNIGQFCELYCGCTHDNLQTKVPFEDLQDYTVGKASDTSTQKIEQIRSQCVKDAHTATTPTNKQKS